MLTTDTASGRHDLATLLASALYGTISSTVVISVLDEDAEGPGDYLLRAGSTAVMLWIAHVYSHWLGATIARAHADRREALRQAALSSPIALAAVPLLVPILLAWTGSWSVATGSEISAWVAVAVLLGAGLLLGVQRRHGPGGVLACVLGSGVLGFLVIVLEQLVH